MKETRGGNRSRRRHKMGKADVRRPEMLNRNGLQWPPGSPSATWADAFLSAATPTLYMLLNPPQTQSETTQVVSKLVTKRVNSTK